MRTVQVGGKESKENKSTHVVQDRNATTTKKQNGHKQNRGKKDAPRRQRPCSHPGWCGGRSVPDALEVHTQVWQATVPGHCRRTDGWAYPLFRGR